MANSNSSDNVDRHRRVQLQVRHLALRGSNYLRFLALQFIEFDYLTAAAALTYTTLFAVLPLMTVTLLSLSLFPDFLVLGKQLQNTVLDLALPSGGLLVQEKLLEFSGRATSLTVVGVLGMFVTALLMLVAVEKALNKIWQVAPSRWGLRRFMVYWSILSLGPGAIIGGTLVSVYLFGLPFVRDLDVVGVGVNALKFMPPIMTAAGLAGLYVLVPNCSVPLRHGLLGGAVAALVFEVGFTVYAGLAKYVFYDAVYGVFAALPVFLLWLYVVWIVILAGAVFVRSLGQFQEQEFFGQTAMKEPQIVSAIRCLRTLSQSHQRGDGIGDKALRRQLKLGPGAWKAPLQPMVQLRLMKRDENQVWILGRDLHTVSLKELMDRLPSVTRSTQLETVEDIPKLVDPVRAVLECSESELGISLEEVVGTW